MKMLNNYPVFKSQLEKSGLDKIENWFGDPRERLICLLQPLIEKSDYRLRINTTDKSAKILELCPNENSARVMGIALHPTKKDVGAFLDLALFEELNRYLILPQENKKPLHKQHHCSLSLEQVWLIVRVIVDMVG